MSLKLISKKICIIFTMTLLAVSMLPITVFAKEKLPNPVNLTWGVNKAEDGREYYNLGWEFSSEADQRLLYGIKEDLVFEYRLYEDGVLINTETAEGKVYCGRGGFAYHILTRDFEKHQYTVGIIITDSNGQYDKSQEVISGVMDTNILASLYDVDAIRESKEYEEENEKRQNGTVATIYYDANGGIKGDKWIDSYNGELLDNFKWPVIGLDYIGGNEVKSLEDDWQSGFVFAPEGMKYAGVEIDGVFYPVGSTIPKIMVTGDIYYKIIWTTIDGGSESETDNNSSSSSNDLNANSTSETAWTGLSDLNSKLQLAVEKGGSQTVTFDGNFALSYDVMKYLQDHPKVTLYYNVFDFEKGETYHTVIKGSNVNADVNIPWYGPQYLNALYGSNGTTSNFVLGDGEYLIQEGDTLSKIATSLGVSVQHLVNANNIENPDVIIAGKVIKY